MPRFFALLVSALLFITGISIVLVQILRFLGLSRMSRGRRERERRRILGLLGRQNVDMAPWKIGEIELLSYKIHYSNKRSLFSRWLQGYAQTIFNEPLLPFAARVYGPDQYILCFTTHDRHYSLVSLGDITEAFVMNKKIGVIRENVLERDGKVIGEIRSASSSYHSIIVNDRDLGHIKPHVTRNDLRITDRRMEMVMDQSFAQEDKDVFTLILGYKIFDPIASQS
ncbi:MAG: hypothetical protein R3275_00245 [Saprospiraceae bacterium]|nr:hypothetical protein [Saprospiraceae bacterium]